jgi:hypothetical protein
MSYTHATAQDWYEGNQAKFEQMCREAIGCEMTVIMEKKGPMTRKFSGIIMEAKPDGFRRRAKSVVVRFTISLKNKSGTVREFTVSKLPRY